jgi:hypothetical protein
VIPILDSPLYGSENLFVALASSVLNTNSIMILQSQKQLTEIAIAGAEIPLVSELNSDVFNAILVVRPGGVCMQGKRWSVKDGYIQF